MKTTEELNAIRKEYETVSKKLSELTVEELEQVVGGMGDFLPDESEEKASPPKYGRGSKPEYGPRIMPGPKYQHHHHHGDCYLTTACMKHLSESFDDNCHELTVLRWFRDNFVKKEDIELYYIIAPEIVEHIDSLPADKQDIIYKDIYSGIVSACVELIENREYEKAYERYMNSTLALKQCFAS